MKLLPLDKLGARETPSGTLNFGIFLPGVSPETGKLFVKIIHEEDQFLQDIQPLRFEMKHSKDANYGNYWSAKVPINPGSKPTPKSAWGGPGRYVYRYYFENAGANLHLDWIIDPYAREFGLGKLSAITIGYQPFSWSSHEESWKTPKLDELVIYELMINEFGGSIDGTIERLDYLADLEINCIEVMPVSNISNTVRWGYLPLGHFGVDERFGKRKDMQNLIDAAHQRKIAVITDMVYGHTSELFAYAYLYEQLLAHRLVSENPFIGSFGAGDEFGKSTDFSKKLTRDFFFTVNHHWLNTYHVDGFRYDCVPNYWDDATGVGYANLVYNTYQIVKTMERPSGHWRRFFDGKSIRLIQCAEHLDNPVEILNKTYSNCAWQNGTLSAARELAKGNQSEITRLGLQLGLLGYPDKVEVNGETIDKTALQYIETHDHPRFICNFGTVESDNELLKEGNRGLWYKVQPYLIGLLTAKGIPLLWQGQEFGENYFLPENGMGRVLLFRPVRWDYFYDSIGQNIVSLVRKLIKIRKQPQFQLGEHMFYNDPSNYQNHGLLLFSRTYNKSFSLVALNFGDGEKMVSFKFPRRGRYKEELHGQTIDVGQDGQSRITIPSNYGRIWTIK